MDARDARIEDRGPGMSFKTRDLAAQLGVSERTVQRDMERLGLARWDTVETGGKGLAHLVHPPRRELIRMVHGMLRHTHRASRKQTRPCDV
jgi:Mn-dependent DtxR family transcriptional regulator